MYSNGHFNFALIRWLMKLSHFSPSICLVAICPFQWIACSYFWCMFYFVAVFLTDIDFYILHKMFLPITYSANIFSLSLTWLLALYDVSCWVRLNFRWFLKIFSYMPCVFCILQKIISLPQSHCLFLIWILKWAFKIFGSLVHLELFFVVEC